MPRYNRTSLEVASGKILSVPVTRQCNIQVYPSLAQCLIFILRFENRASFFSNACISAIQLSLYLNRPMYLNAHRYLSVQTTENNVLCDRGSFALFFPQTTQVSVVGFGSGLLQLFSKMMQQFESSGQTWAVPWDLWSLPAFSKAQNSTAGAAKERRKSTGNQEKENYNCNYSVCINTRKQTQITAKSHADGGGHTQLNEMWSTQFDRWKHDEKTKQSKTER